MSRQRPLSAPSKVRNSFRPFFNDHKNRPFWKQMQTVRQQTRSTDFAAICTITEGNAAYPFPGLGNTFPQAQRTVPNSSFRHLNALEVRRELALHVARLNHHATKLAAALGSLVRINEYLARHALEEAEATIAAHKEAYGLSFVLLKKELLLALEQHGLPGLAKAYKRLTEGNESTAWAVLCHFVYDSMDPTFHPYLALRAWLDVSARRLEKSEWYARLLEEEILTRSETDAALSSAFLRFSALSLLDLAILLWRKRTAHPRDTRLQSAFGQLHGSMRDVLVEKFSRLYIGIPNAYRLSGRSPIDIEVYRTSFFFDDIASIAAWRIQMNRLIFASKFKIPSLEHDEVHLRLDAAAAAIATAPHQCQKNIEDLGAWEKSFLHPGSEFADQKFLTAAVISESLRKMAQGVGTDPVSVAHLLASVEDVHLYTAMDTLKGLLDADFARTSPLLCFVLREMIYRRARTQDNELERRLAFMKLFNAEPRAQVTDLLDEIVRTSVDTAILMARTCTRTFLERLYLMMTSVKDVLETRLGVCRWLVAREDEPDDSVREECDALERELANLDARSDLDSTRVHVDEESLREWFNITQQANATRYIQTVLAEGPATGFGSLLSFYSDRAKTNPEEEDLTADTQIGSEFLLVGIVDATLKAFASDRTFGLDAYLSRRIRHGTLSGHVMTPVNRVLKRLSEVRDLRERDREPDDLSGIEYLVQEWRRFLVNELDQIRKNVIQIKTAEHHPKGLIHATWQTAPNITHVDAMIGRVRSRVIETGGAYDIFSDIYSLCWDCLEPDLAHLRLYMVREFLPRAIRRLDELLQELSPRERLLASGFSTELHATLQARVQEVCGWFIRPVFRRDRYSLKMLIMSTLSIVRELDERYKFTEDVAMSDDISLNRRSFDMFEAALFVLIGNAAKHGKPDGQISVSAGPVEGRNGLVLLKVTSEVSNLEQHREGVSRIRSALTVREDRVIDRAAVEEGFSGLRKLAGLVLRVQFPDVVLAIGAPEEDLRITFWLTLPAEITFGAPLA